MKNNEQLVISNEEAPSAHLDLSAPIYVDVGMMGLVLPAAVAFQVASTLKQVLLDKYELVPGVPTVEEPEGRPYFRLLGVEDDS